MSAAPTIIAHWNEAVPSAPGVVNPSILNDTNSPYLARVNNGVTIELRAKERLGLVLLEYRQGTNFLAVQAVDLREPDPFAPPPPTSVDIGFPLAPSDLSWHGTAAAAKPKVSRGMDPGAGATLYAYQHDTTGVPQYGMVWAIRKATGDKDIEVFWRRKAALNIEWPYELHRYQADWPTATNRYQLYVRGSKGDVGVAVTLPNTISNVTVKPYQDPDGHAGKPDARHFSTTQPGRSLLQYDYADGSVAFQVVRSVWNTDTSIPGLITATNWDIGAEITEPLHEGPIRWGYLYVPEGNRYDWEIYDADVLAGAEVINKPSGWQTNWTTKQIFAVNTGLLEVWWSRLNQGVQWPCFVKRYTADWPANPGELVIASRQSMNIPAAYTNFRLYTQNDPFKAGFNPNDEHAWSEGRALYAARSDLGTPATSLPYLLLKSQSAVTTNQWKFDVVHVLAEKPGQTFTIDGGKVGLEIGCPAPISKLKGPANANYAKDYGVSGPHWADRRNYLWAYSAGNDGQPTNIVVRFFYPVQAGFYFPSNYFAHFPAGVTVTNTPLAGSLFPWLDLHQGTPTQPQNITYTVHWPDDTDPELTKLDVGQTLLPGTLQHGSAALDASSVDILYQQSERLNQGPSIRLYAPLLPTVVTNVILDGSLTESENNRRVFPSLPSSLRTRLIYNTAASTLTLAGEAYDFSQEPLTLPNVLSLRDIEWLLQANQSASYQAAISQLTNQAVPHVLLTNMPYDLGDIALEAATGTGVGYVTLALNNSTTLLTVGEQEATKPTLQVVKVSTRLHTGAIQIVRHATDSPISDKLTLRFNGELGGRPDDYDFHWEFSKNGVDGWHTFPIQRRTGAPNEEPVGRGAVEITVQGPGPATLSDNFFRCQYRRLTAHSVLSTNIWSDWAYSGVAEGWIKRAMTGLNLFDQRYKDLRNGVDTRSPIAVAGRPWNGQVPFNREAVERAGLIELYETILRTGINLSLEGIPPLAYDPEGNRDLYQALILAASRLSDLYLLVGNEAYADSADPTIGIGADFNRSSSAMFCFQDQADIPNLLAEELALLRGRTPGSAASSLQNPPVFNRLQWNFSGGLGQTAYINNYNIRAFGSPGEISSESARAQYPLGHGDAWGHYLTATMNFYRLLTATNFAWMTTNEWISVPGAPDLRVNYQYERQFVSAAAAKAKTGGEIMALTYRQQYREDPEQQFLGYPDADSERAWGVGEWASRVGQGALFDWIVGNAMLPPGDGLPAQPGEQKVDRTTVVEFREIESAFATVQQHADNMDAGLNPLGIAKNAIPFGLDETAFKNGKKHFEQIYERAVVALNNAIGVFNYANQASQMLRRQADTQVDFRQGIEKQENDYTNRLIEAFGRPYNDDIGPGKTYPTGYTGPDTEDGHFLIGDPSAFVGVTPRCPVAFTFTNRTSTVLTNGNLAVSDRVVTLYISQEGFGMVKPPTWTSTTGRAATGEIQTRQMEVFQAKARYDKTLQDYHNLLAQIEDQAALLQAQYKVNAVEVRVLYEGAGVTETLDDAIRRSRERQIEFQTKARTTTMNANALAEGLPALTGLIVGTSSGFMADLWGAARFLILDSANRSAEVATRNANSESLGELDLQQAKEIQQTYQNIVLTTIRQEQGVLQQVAQLQQLIRQESSLRLDLYTMLESIQQAAANFRTAVARGQRLPEERQRFRQQTAEQVQAYRYRDLAFRIFRNDALQKYRAQFDLAAMYTYLAAKAYDYETCLLQIEVPGKTNRAGEQFLQSIVQKRAIGEVSPSGDPIGGTGQKDPGLADPLKVMKANFDVLKDTIGIGNPVTRERLFSVRYGAFRIRQDAAGYKLWRDTLNLPEHRVANIWALPEFRAFCRPPRLELVGGESGIVIEFPSAIYADKNFFNWPAGGGEYRYNPTFFAAKIVSIGLWFSGYDSTTEGLDMSPYAYLIPVGLDVSRVPDAFDFQVRTWRVVDQKIPMPLDFRANPSLVTQVGIPLYDGLSDTFAEVRRFSAFDVSVDTGSGTLDTSKMAKDMRLVGRSVWNTRWILIIPGVALYGSDPAEGIERFINGRTLSNGQRSGNGVTDIKLYFETYHYSGY